MPKFSSLRLFDISFSFYFKGYFAKDIFINIEPFFKDGEECWISKGVKEETYRI